MTGGTALTGGGHADHIGAGGHAAHASQGAAALGPLGAALACTLVFAWPALRVALAPEARRLTGRSMLAAAAAACALGVPLALTWPSNAVDPHLWGMIRFELLAVLGPALLVHAVRATGPAARRRYRGASLGAVVWTVSAYAWHLPPLHLLDGPGAEAARSSTWVAAGLLLCLPVSARPVPFLVAHLAVLPLAALMAVTGRGGAGLLMAVVDVAMAGCLLAGRYTDVNIGSNPWLYGSSLRYGLRDRDRKASDARGRERAAHEDRSGHARRGLDAPLLAARRPERGTRRRTAPGGPEGAGAGPGPVPHRGR
ncbi:hypothetical protein [Streptomyces sp. NPDC048282]|uniref:hypothetical protein n=1 Tax=Streptomyces sp. NPDC048282 TaxID=3365528 RepID=UPI0037217892